MKKYLVTLFAIFTAFYMANAQSDILNETEGYESFASNNGKIIAKQATNKKQKSIPDGGLLLIPESSGDRVLAFDPQTGDLVDENFIIENGQDFFSTPIQVIQNPDKTRLYVSDQIEDVVLEFDNDGNYIGIFAPAGGPNISICDNIRGISLKHASDHILVSDGTHDAILEFDGSGNYVGTFTSPGLADPFDVVYWPVNDQYLINDISGTGSTDKIIVIDNSGGFVNNLVSTLNFPEQIAIAPGGNILVATFSSPSGIYEFQPDGTQVGYYDVVSSCRGVYELPNGNFLVTSGIGVYEISKSNTLVDTKYEASGNSFRFISFVSPPGDGIYVTFRVDMTFQSVPPEGVHIAGNFQGWDPGLTAMSTPGGNIYTYTGFFQPGDTLEYKFINGDEWGEDENVPPECAQNTNRYLIVPEADTTLMVVCFSSCDPCGMPAEVTFQVDMSEQIVSPNGVHVAGNFQGWNSGLTSLIAQGDNLYAATITLPQGDSIEYKFINGNSWDGVEFVPEECGIDDGQGGYNRYMTVPLADTTLTNVCFSSCDPCPVNPPQVNVTFRIDMSEESISFDGVHIAGDFQGWDPATTELSDIGNDLYEVVLTLFSSDYYEYKFINGITWDEAESVPEECGVDDGQGGYNRYITVPEVDTILTNVCFNSCDTCLGGTGRNISSIERSGVIAISPNPFSSNLTIQYYTTEKAIINISILNAYGKVIHEATIEKSDTGEHSYSTSMTALSKGIYFCRLEIISDNNVITELKKIIKQ